MQYPTWRLARRRAQELVHRSDEPYAFYKFGDTYRVSRDFAACTDGAMVTRPFTICFPSGEIKSYSIGEDISNEVIA